MYLDIKGYEGLYQISNQGDVKSFAKNGRILKSDEGKYGHGRVTLSKYGKTKRFLVHRLVATHFIPNPENKSQVNHIDSNPRNNNVENLEWVTHQENAIHGYDFGNKRKAVKAAGDANKKLSQEQIEEIKILKSTTSLSNKAIGAKFGVGKDAIRRLIKGDTYGT